MGMTFEQFIDNLKSAFNNANVDNVNNIVDNSTPDIPTAPLSVAPPDGGVSEGGAPDPSGTNDNGDMIRTMIHEELLNIVQNMNKPEPTPAIDPALQGVIPTIEPDNRSSEDVLTSRFLEARGIKQDN